MRRFVLTAALGFILGLGSCQGSRVEDMGGAEAAGPSRLPFSQDLRQALFELDALPSPAGVDGGVFEKLKEALSVMLIEGAGRTASAGGVSCLTDMQVQEVNEDGTDYLEWRYTLFGDYDLNGEVNIADITPIAQNFTETFPFADPRVAWVDGDRNGEINVSDLTPLGQHFGVSVLTYSVFRSAQGADPPGWTETGTLDVRDLADDVLGGLGFRYELEADHGDFTYKVLPRSGTWHRNEIGAPDVIPPVMGAVSGLVTDTDGQPLAGVDITLTLPGSSEEYTAQSDEAGLYIVGRIDLSAIYAPRVDVQLRYSLDGYAEGFESATVWGGRCAVREIQLLERTIEGKVPSKAGGSVGTKSALQLTLPPAGLVRADGTPMLIAADVALTYIDYTDPRRLASAPGDLSARQLDGGNAQLKSFGMAEVFIDEGTGQAADIAPGKTADLSFPIPEGERASAPETTGLYSFDEELGRWVEEGQAVKNAEGDAYIAEISHLSYWNCDDPIAPTLIKVKVVDMDGTLVPEATVVSAGVTYSGTTDQVTSANGMATFVVEQSAVERVSATYMGYFLGEKEVDTPSEYVTSYEAPLVATFTAPFDLAQLTIYAETDDGTPVPFAFVYLRDEGELWATELQAGEDSAARIHLIAGDTLSVWATDGVHASATQHLTIGDEEVIELHVAISDAIPLPVARFTISEYEGLAPMSIILDASASSPAGEITSYHWRVSSEGGTIAEATEADPQYELALPEPGHYIVNLELETASGSLDTERGAVCVY